MELQNSYVTDAVFDTKTGAWFKVSGPRGVFWFSGSGLLNHPTSIFSQIGTHTGHYLTDSRSKQQLHREVREVAPRDGAVAAQSGWFQRSFICGDGKILSDNNSVDLVTFEPLPKFTAKAKLDDWHTALGPYVDGQTLPFFVIALSLTGPLLRLLPSGTLNPLVELTGEKLSGKSTLGVLAASVWSGDSEKTEGGGESWNMTLNTFDLRRHDHRDMLLVLDEAEGGGSNDRDRQNLARSVIFTGATTSRKARMTDVNRSPEPLRLAVLSTSNTSVLEVLRNEPTARREAAASRVLLITVSKDSGHGLPIFDNRPSNFDAATAASELRMAIDRAYGTAGPAFASALVEKNSRNDTFTAELYAKLTETVQRLQRIDPSADIRQCRTLAAIELAAKIAQEAGVLPLSWGKPSLITDTIFQRITKTPMNQSSTTTQSENARFQKYVREYKKKRKFTHIGRGLIPVPTVCKMFPGFITRSTDNKIELLVSPQFFESTFSDASTFLRRARTDGRLRIHPSEPDRFQVRAPKWMQAYGFKRVYAIRLSSKLNHNSERV